MQVTMEHRQVSRPMGGAADHFLDCTVRFSEEEKAIIRLKGLNKLTFTISSALAPLTAARWYTTNAIFIASKFGMMIAGGTFIVAGIARWENLSGAAMLAVFPLFFLYLYLKFFTSRQISKRVEREPQTIRVRDLVEGHPMTVWRNSPAALHDAEDEIKEQLLILKSHLEGSGDTRQKETFEL